MSRVNIDKLNQIKLKYGYASQHNNHNDAKIKAYLTNQRENTFDSKTFQNVVLSKGPQRSPTPISYQSQTNTSQGRRERTVSVNFKKNLLQRDGICESKVTPFHLEKREKSDREIKELKSPFNSQQPSNGVSNSKNELKSFEKTYDLLKNYRMKIRTGFDNQHEQHSSKLIIKEDKENQPRQFHKAHQSRNYQSTNKNQNSQMKLMPHNRQRCSPLASLDQNSVDVRKELSNIQKLQSKIRSVLGVDQ